MIRDVIALTEIQQSWAGVETLRSRLQANALASWRPASDGTFPFILANAAYNLPFIHAYAVLNDVLRQLADEGHFTCKSIFLGALLEKSEQILLWRNFALINAGAQRRNDGAHHGQLLDRGDCWKYVDAVKLELAGWAII